MSTAIEKARWLSAAVVVVGIAAGCAAPSSPREVTATSTQALASSNGLGQNGLSTNGLWTNGLWTNGLWTNGLWTNGLWTNGLWTNGLWTNGLWTNGLWTNGLWTNGLWTNGLWTNGLWTNGLAPGSGVAKKGSPAYVLQASPYARELLQYVYACAMPRAGTPNPDGGAPLSFDTTIDPNNGTLACSPPAPCADAGFSGDADQDAGAGSTCSSQPTCPAGYTCSSQNTCVVPLTGAIGLGINADGTHWWDPPAASEGGASEAGTCDESCQRWVSACVLARTNAYGVHVEISMRAPADAPQGIKDALATTSDEVASYTLREGAYYGNIFATTPVNPAPSSTYSGPANGPIAETPSFYACAGPGSNIPEITKRFCSSQGDQAVINVPGVCLATATDAGAAGAAACAGEDTDPTSPTFGAIQDCYTETATTETDGGVIRTGTAYTQVITVYLKEPIAVCGNAVCEETETPANCPSDCHPGTWATDYAQRGYVGEGPVLNPFYGNLSGMSAVAPDDTIVVTGAVQSDVDLGGGTLSATAGWGVLAKYHSDGSYAWGVRFGSASKSALGTVGANGGQFLQVFDVKVASSGNITIEAQGVEDIGSSQYATIWVFTFTADGAAVGSFGLPIGPGGSLSLGRSPQPGASTQDFALDSQGNIVLSGNYSGTATFGSISLTSAFPVAKATEDALDGNAYLAKVSPQGTVLWAQSLGGSGDDFPTAVAVDSADNILLATISGQNYLSTSNGLSTLQKLSPDGAGVWSTGVAPDGVYLATAVDPSGNVYATGYFGSGQDFGGGAITSIAGLEPFIVKYGPDGSFQWVNYANMVCPPSRPKCVGESLAAEVPRDQSGLFGTNIGFDPAGDPVIASRGIGIGGVGVDFGVGTFPTYHASNIFLSAYSADAGRLQWAKQIPTILSGRPSGVAMDSQGRVVVSGQYAGSMQSDDALLVTPDPQDDSAQGFDGFLSSFNAPSLTDTTPPAIGAGTDQSGAAIFTVPNDIFTQATSAAGAVVFFMPPTAIDTGYAGTSVACSPPPNTTYPIGTTTVTCTASDPVGNHSTATFTVTVVDMTPPVLTVPSNITALATGPGGATVTYTAPIATDQVDGSVTPVCTPASNSTFALGTTTVSCAATDAHGNSSTATFTVTVVDTTPPVLTVPANITAAATGPGGAVVTFAASATDIVDGTDPVTCSPPSGSTFAIGTTTVMCTASDAAGNASSASFAVTVADTTPPVVAVPANITTPATGPTGATVAYSASASDIVYGAITPTCVPASDSVFAIGSTTVTCSATDPAGNTGIATFTVTVTDTTPPVVAVPSNITTQATGPSGATVTFTATATDIVDGTAPVTCSPASGSTFALGTTTVTCTATDAHGNTDTASFTVTVVGQPSGDACTAASQCASGYCVTGVCCNTACGGGTAASCEACSVALGASVNGTCAAITTQNLNASDVCSGAVCAPAGKTISANITVPASASCVLIGAYSGNVTEGKSSSLTLAGASVQGNVTATGGGSSLTLLADASVKGNVQATNAASVTFSAGSSVSGNVQTTDTGSVAIMNSTIGGDAQAQACGTFSLSGSTVKGNLEVQEDTSTTNVTNDTVSGNVQIQQDADGVVCSGNKVKGNIQIQGNTGGVSVTGNTWSGNLQCQQNVPPATKPASQCGG
jgi:hypothetical protein